MEALNQVRAAIDKAVSWIKWGTGVGLVLMAAIYVLEFAGVRIAGLPPATTAIYVAGFWWLVR